MSPHHDSTEIHALNLFRGFIQVVRQTAAQFLPMYITQNKTHPPCNRIFQENFLISERNHLEYLLENLLWFLKSPEMCGAGNKGIKLMNYVALSCIYRIRDEAYVFGEIIVNPLGILILSGKWSSSWSLISFRQVGGLGIGWWKFRVLLRWWWFWYSFMPLSRVRRKLPLSVEPVLHGYIL